MNIDLKTAESLDVLTREGITHVVNLIAHKQSENNAFATSYNIAKINKLPAKSS
jgi:hypothetical protein